MIKKIIVILLLLNTFLFSEDNNLHAIKADYNNGKVTFQLRIDKEELGEPFIHGPKDWVALYKKGHSSSWKNVLTWAWVKDFKATDISGEIMRLSKNIHLQDGEYEVRYFKNNTYTVYKSSTFLVNTTSGINLDRMTAHYTREFPAITFSLGSFLNTKLRPNPKDWIGFYKKGDSNSWGNVITWVWVKDIINPVPVDIKNIDAVYTVKKVNLQSGEYEVRYFLNNSYKTYKSSSFTVD